MEKMDENKMSQAIPLEDGATLKKLWDKLTGLINSADSVLLKPHFIWLTTVLPLTCLILLLLKDYAVVWAQMTATNNSCFFGIIGMALLSIAVGTVLALIERKKHVRQKFCWIILLTEVVCLIVSCSVMEEAQPDVEQFILPDTRWFCYLFTFYMPGLVYALMAITEHIRSWKAMLISFVMALVIPYVLYLSFIIIVNLGHLLDDYAPTGHWFENIEVMGIIGLIIVIALAFYFAVCKLLITTSRLCVGLRYFRPVAAGLVGVFLPLSGLSLNTVIPFPCDLQGWPVYLLTILNGALLFCGVMKWRPLNYILVFLKGVSYWFALYFFLLFLPWLPLFVPAIIACGAGVLILTPTLLFVFENYIYARDFATLKEQMGRRRLISLFAAGLLVTPAIFCLNAWHDRVQLDQVVKYYYHSPRTIPMAEQFAEFNPKHIGKVMKRLNNFRNGVETPYIDELYNKIVFSGLVLSQSQVNQICYDLNGDLSTSASIFGRRYHSFPMLSLDRPAEVLPDNRPQITDRKIELLPDGSGARLKLVLGGTNAFSQEYVGKIRIPEGVHVTGMTLKINDEVVPGRIFERKSAFWIYQKITEAKRDPSLMYYSSSHELTLRVFPVTMAEPREVTVDLAYPQGDTCEIVLDGKTMVLPESTVATGWRYLSPETLRQSGENPGRKPELVFVIDRSTSQEIIKKHVSRILDEFPEAETFRLVSGIVAAGEMTTAHRREDQEEAWKEFAEIYHPGKGGFSPHNVIKGAMLQYDVLNRPDSGKFPIFAVVVAKTIVTGLNLRHFERFAPEYPWLVVDRSNIDSKSVIIGLETLERVFEKPSPRDVRRLADGRIVAVENGAVIRDGQPAGKYDELQTLWKRSLKLIDEPETEEKVLAGLIADSRNTGALLPQNSMIVLETEAQWKTLENTEQKKLSRSSAFDIEETRAPEPSFWMLLAIGLFFLLGTFLKQMVHRGRL